jgi:hypothetical protein
MAKPKRPRLFIDDNKAAKILRRPEFAAISEFAPLRTHAAEIQATCCSSRSGEELRLLNQVKMVAAESLADASKNSLKELFNTNQIRIVYLGVDGQAKEVSY